MAVVLVSPSWSISTLSLKYHWRYFSCQRVRVLLDRYGILFRELLQREAPGFQWTRVDYFRWVQSTKAQPLAAFLSGVQSHQNVCR